jgi:hypothetical protein
MPGDEAERFSKLIEKLEEVDRPNDYGFELVRNWPGFAFVKELYERQQEIVMQEISNRYDRSICPRAYYVGRTDFTAGKPDQALWTYDEAEIFHRNDLDAYHKGVPIFVNNEAWTSRLTGESGLWMGLKIWTRGERKLLWGFEFNAEWG